MVVIERVVHLPGLHQPLQHRQHPLAPQRHPARNGVHVHLAVAGGLLAAQKLNDPPVLAALAALAAHKQLALVVRTGRTGRGRGCVRAFRVHRGGLQQMVQNLVVVLDRHDLLDHHLHPVLVRPHVARDPRVTVYLKFGRTALFLVLLCHIADPFACFNAACSVLQLVCQRRSCILDSGNTSDKLNLLNITSIKLECIIWVDLN